jgi:predicted MFS family arabinose efflux permease
MLTVDAAFLTVPYVMAAQALSGVAKDLTKMSSKSYVKLVVREDDRHGLMRWVSVLTGSKNTLKGAGFFLGGVLLATAGFRGACAGMAAALAAALVGAFALLPRAPGKASAKLPFKSVLSDDARINWLSVARFFLFGSRDVWFVLALPIFLADSLGWSFYGVGGFLALWVIGYGIVQASAPRLIRRSHHGRGPGGGTARLWAFVLAAFPAAIALGLQYGLDPALVIVTGLVLFGIVFAINSAVHSYLILAYSDFDKVSMNVGFYYMANAGGRLAGTVLSGLVYQTQGLQGCLWWSAGFVLAAALMSFKLPEVEPPAETGRQAARV